LEAQVPDEVHPAACRQAIDLVSVLRKQDRPGNPLMSGRQSSSADYAPAQI